MRALEAVRLEHLIEALRDHSPRGGNPRPRLAPGQLVRGRVEAALADGSYRVRIGVQTLEAELTAPARPGTAWQFRVLASGPHPVLEPVTAAALEQAATADLSETATLIAALAREDEPATVAAPARPLIAAAPADAGALAARLAQALDQSGLFYEAHLAQWAAGERPFAALREEPQARIASTAREISPNILDGESTAETPARAETSRLAGHADTHTIVRQQLEALATRAVSWAGEAWPGQWIEWRIVQQQDDAGPPPRTRSADDPAWQTRVALTLPHLGSVTAVLGFAARGVTVALRASDAARAGVLERESGALRQSLQAAGIPALALQVAVRAE